MPSHSRGVPKLADRIAEALYARIATETIDRLDAVFSEWQPGQGIHVEAPPPVPVRHGAVSPPHGCQRAAPEPGARDASDELTADYLHAQLCNAALHAFAAENEARMEAMAAARNQIERQLAHCGRRSGCAGGDHGGDRRTGRRRDREPISPDPIALQASGS